MKASTRSGRPVIVWEIDEDRELNSGHDDGEVVSTSSVVGYIPINLLEKLTGVHTTLRKRRLDVESLNGEFFRDKRFEVPTTGLPDNGTYVIRARLGRPCFMPRINEG